IPPTSYSRVEIAVVSGAITRCVSSLADTVSVQPSGEFVVLGGEDSTRPSSAGTASGGGAAAVGTSGETASVFGSAAAIGVVREKVSAKEVSTASGRTSTAQPSSAGIHSAKDHYPRIEAVAVNGWGMSASIYPSVLRPSSSCPPRVNPAFAARAPTPALPTAHRRARSPGHAARCPAEGRS